jgi:flagellar M-ring protein FliF
MDFLNQAIAQISAVFRTLSAGAKITVGLLMILIVVSMAYLFNRQVASPDTYLFGGQAVDAADLPAMQAAFGSANLKNFVMEGNQIKVPAGEQASYMAALGEAGALPSAFGSHFQKAIDSSSPWTSRGTQELKTKQGYQQDLAHIIKNMKFISNAAVNYDIREEKGLNPKKIITASVSVMPKGGQPLDERKVAAIRNVISNALGMPAESVAVTDLTNGIPFPAGKPGDAGFGNQSPEFQTRVAAESSYNQKIADALAFIPGVRVQTNVQLEKEIVDEEYSQRFEKGVPTLERGQKDNSKSTLPGPAGRPGLQSQGAIANSASSISGGTGPTNGSTEKKSEQNNTAYATPTTETVKRRAPLAVNTVSASISVPSSYYEKIWMEQELIAKPGTTPKRPTPEQWKPLEDKVSQSIVEHVKSIVPIPGGQTFDKILRGDGNSAPKSNKDLYPVDLIRVTTFQSLTEPELPATSVAETATGWFGQNWSSVATGLFGLVSLVMLRSLVKGVPTTAADADEEFEDERHEVRSENESDEVAGAAAEEKAAPAVKKLARRAKSGTSLRDELVEIVREDPDTAANVLKTWISSST